LGLEREVREDLGMESPTSWKILDPKTSLKRQENFLEWDWENCDLTSLCDLPVCAHPSQLNDEILIICSQLLMKYEFGLQLDLRMA